MVNSARKNIMSRRNHRERAQPLHRAKLGILEKHKDYVHRARDYNSKKARIKKLREKAAFRNKDEFYFGMVKGRTERGVHIQDRGNEALSVDVVKLLKTQDMGYIKMQIAQDEKKITRLRAQLEVTAPAGGSEEWGAAQELAEVEKLAEMGVVLDPSAALKSKSKGKGRARDAPSTGHVVFAEDRTEFEGYAASGEKVEEAEEEEEAVDLGWLEPESAKKRKAVKSTDANDEAEVTEEDARIHRLEMLAELSALLGRVRTLRQVETRIANQKGLMGKGAARRVRDAGYVEDPSAPEDRNGDRKKWQEKMWKWKLERKK
ncbi:small-subunit processome [Cutaneotrichosporon oleaginosum]|uniref:Small-subunit processome n=1 Tax=Cutaneotrichosporon oleaginosum TaxID=879819 RepID=A0A0J0XHV7_9TREE|nr:small-subunit processome [Cutaneotrichosporon oleaginosum]KLT40710.1 small-subunit processome [Cutaneotrichosporon oleaginosum]TXT14240.1 hypothetical protein COLE_00433 [Cutaneotrichosporon oleaginosum]